MAMISCPGCGEQISDKSKKCIHCGYILVEEPKKTCSECGAELEAGATVCPKCGCPVEIPTPEVKERVPQQVEVTKVNIKPQINKKAIIIAVVAIVLIVCAVFGVKKVQEQKAREAAADYGENLETLTYLMLSGAADAESAGNLIKSVWFNSIYEEKDSSTDKYTRKNNGSGSFYDDFNDALGNLFSDSSFQTKIGNIESNQESVAAMMKDMKNPPEEWEEAYEDLQEFYDVYLDLTNLATNPTGSLQTFSSNFNDADTDVSAAFSRMALYFD